MEQLYSCRNSLLSLFFIIFVIISADAVSSPVTYEGENVVVEGQPFQILCRLTVFDTMKWQRNGATVHADENTRMTLSEDASGGGIIGKLMVRKARENDTGEYTCSSFGGPGHTVVVVGAIIGVCCCCCCCCWMPNKELRICREQQCPCEGFIGDPRGMWGFIRDSWKFQNQPLGIDYAGSVVNVIGNFDFDSYKVIEYKSSLTLQCNLTADESVAESYSVKWLKNEKPLDAALEKRVELPEANRLVIPKALDTDAGNYTCVFNHKKNSSELRLDFNVVFKPYVKLPPHTSVVEGEKLTITCTIFSDPVPTVYWRIGNKTYEDSEGRVKLLENKEKGIPKAILQIDEANMDDRNTYTCGATNVGNKYSNGTEASTYVRVKDKLAALWPFLGICAEVIVLCTIILIYEKKRNKTELDESDTDGSPEQKNTPDHTKESEIRQRKRRERVEYVKRLSRKENVCPCFDPLFVNRIFPKAPPQKNEKI